MTITVITMANTKLTIPTEKACIDIAMLCVVLVFFSAINLFWAITPIATRNEYIYSQLDKAVNLPVPARLALFSSLREQQEKALARKPGDPYGWARLAYLRITTEGNLKSAFDALRMSDLVSPYEAPQLPERAAMWHKFASIETREQLSYQDTLWQKAYNLKPDTTWETAKREGITKEAGESLMRKDPALYEAWKNREASDH
jgi:hypothetical protein